MVRYDVCSSLVISEASVYTAKATEICQLSGVVLPSEEICIGDTINQRYIEVRIMRGNLHSFINHTSLVSCRMIQSSIMLDRNPVVKYFGSNFYN